MKFIKAVAFGINRPDHVQKNNKTKPKQSFSMTSPLASSLKFTVRRSNPELIAPAKPTPHEFKKLSDLDNEKNFQVLEPGIHIYPHNVAMEGKDPVKIIREALAQILTLYYPLAGRLRRQFEDGFDEKIFVECNGEGAVFIEADANVTVNDFGDAIHPPFHYLDEVMYPVSGMAGIFDCPTFHVQVTRLRCGSFILATLVNHVMMDGTGYAQLMTSLSEVARGVSIPSISPVWQRELLCARNPPQATFIHPTLGNATKPIITSKSSYSCFYFTNNEISILRNLISDDQKKSSSFDLITACLWRCRTIALRLDPNEEVRMMIVVNVRDKYNPPLPKGYYGNAIAYTTAKTTAEKLCENPLEYAVKLVRAAKKEVTEEYVRSFIDKLAARDSPQVSEVPISWSFVSDLRRMGFQDIDFGWGQGVYGGIASPWTEPYPYLRTCYVKCKNAAGEDVTLVPVSLPKPVMERFVEEVLAMAKVQGIESHV